MYSHTCIPIVILKQNQMVIAYYFAGRRCPRFGAARVQVHRIREHVTFNMFRWTTQSIQVNTSFTKYATVTPRARSNGRDLLLVTSTILLPQTTHERTGSGIMLLCTPGKSEIPYRHMMGPVRITDVWPGWLAYPACPPPCCTHTCVYLDGYIARTELMPI